MEVHLLRSTTIARLLASGLAALLLVACGAHEVEVRGDFPQPVLEKLPMTLGVYYNPEFRSHTFHEVNKERRESDWIVKTGDAQVKMYNTLLQGMFEKVVYLNDIPRRERVTAVGEEQVDAVLVPAVDELQYSIPRQSKINVFEIWLRYRYQLYAPDGELLADWTMTSYGKTPTATLQRAESAVNLAAIVALRDAGANFAMNFTRVPEVKLWMESSPSTEQGENGGTSAAGPEPTAASAAEPIPNTEEAEQ
jgi:hypothetical protein